MAVRWGVSVYDTDIGFCDFVSKGTETHLDYNLLQSLKRDISSENHKSLEQKAEGIYKLLLPSLQCCFDQVREKGSSSWLSAIPIVDRGFHLNKGEFRDALCLRYDCCHLQMFLNIAIVENCSLLTMP